MIFQSLLKRVALEEDSLQELMAVCSNGASLKEWSHADVVKAITLWSQAGPGKRHSWAEML